MSDKTLATIGRTCARTAARLRELQAQLYQCGLTGDAANLEVVIREQLDVAEFCSPAQDTGVFKRPVKD